MPVTKPDESQKKKKPSLFGAACSFYRAVTEGEHLPPAHLSLPEIAFWGRSNVGKSSLVNALTGKKNLARTSNTPGRTQQIILFNLGHKLMLADLPGYGHAEAPKKIIQQWTRLIDSYLACRPNLACVYLLIDSRHGVLKKDEEAMAYLDTHAISYQVVLTKADYLTLDQQKEREDALTQALVRHPAARPCVISVSSKKKQGMDRLRADIALYA